MKYTYAYKTSDGARHEGEMSASSREEVFRTLRSMGIKPIKVVAADGSKANGEIVVRGIRKRVVAVFVLFAAILAALISHFLFPGVQPQAVAVDEGINFTTEASRVSFTNLESQAAAILTAHRKAVDDIEFNLLTNYQFIENSKDSAVFISKIKAGYRAVDMSRARTRDLFKSIFTIFPADCAAERTAAQRLYAQTMDAIDLSEDRIVNDESAFRLLDANRDKWHSANGKVVWTDAALANEFEYFRRDVNPSSVRWRKDFTGAEPRISNAQNGK